MAVYVGTMDDLITLEYVVLIVILIVVVDSPSGFGKRINLGAMCTAGRWSGYRKEAGG